MLFSILLSKQMWNEGFFMDPGTTIKQLSSNGCLEVNAIM